MSKEIWLGPLLGDNRSKLIERCAEFVSKGQPDRFLYLAASHPLLELVTEGVLDGQRNAGVWGELPVYLFRGFVRRIISTAVNDDGTRLSPRTPIDREELPLKRSLVSQVLARLVAAGQLKAIAPLANREGCVNTISTLIGEIERAAKTPAEVAQIIKARGEDLASGSPLPSDALSRGLHRQIDFDREVALIYETYSELLERHQLTEADADSLRALTILNREPHEMRATLPWLGSVQLLVLDGFFDFTPVQGEILRRLIPDIPEVIVNLNYDDRNPEIFLPFQDTIEHLAGIAPFEKKLIREELVPAAGALSGLRASLFNSSLEKPADNDLLTEPAEPDAERKQSEIKYFECGDRETEIRAVAKEVKRLVLRKDFRLEEIALVVRQKASYADTLSRVMREEALPCNLESRIDATDIPGLRAALKLFAILEESAREGADSSKSPRLAELADLIKSEYFRPGREELAELSLRFDQEYREVFGDGDVSQVPDESDEEKRARLKHRHRIGDWDADALENAFAYVGSDLRVSAWLERAQKLIKELPAAAATRDLLNINTEESGEAGGRDPDEADQVENAETAKVDSNEVEKKRRPSRDIHPAALAWASLVVKSFAGRIQTVPREGRPAELRVALMALLDQLSFREQISRPVSRLIAEHELPRALLNFNSLEVLRRAFVAAIKSIEIAAGLSEAPASAGGLFSPPPAHAGGSDKTSLATFIDEVRRAISSQSVVSSAADSRGLRVLEATDVRGLRFRAVFIAGLVEGGFPLRASRDWIYPHEERERLKNYGLTLEDISPATLLKEEHYFYQAACRATERLYLSRPLVLADDSETVASYYIDELRRAVSPLTLETKTIRRDYDGWSLNELDNVSTAPELDRALVRQQERHLHRGEKNQLLPEPRIARFLALARNDGWLTGSALRRIEIERERAGKRFGPYDGQITDPHLLALLNQRFGPEFMHSASGLSLYGNCAYKFFGQRILKLEPRGEAALDLQAIDAGKLLHDILRRFFEQYRRQPLSQFDRDELQQELMRLADKVFDEHEGVVPPLNKQIWKIDREIRKILLEQVLLYELDIQERASAHGVVPAYFEVAFGSMKSHARDPGSTDQALELSRSTFVGEESMKISGQIDRVDVSTDNTLIAYDYKLSTGSSKEDIKSGRSLQLPIYLEALERLILPDHTVAGGGYYVIRGGIERRNRGLHRATALQYSGIKKTVLGVMSDEEWQQIRAGVIAKIWDFLDHMRAGNFSVQPSEKLKTCRFCDFSAVCRYERYRIDAKDRSDALRG
ncbi:MAG TPA: PD-(D/E)XK nuclease family protein [Pyrinomonadaceae bacterium]|nr:PD-(D/E)XK nuclease family protein [Pyrinomonadaceae bacterium]